MHLTRTLVFALLFQALNAQVPEKPKYPEFPSETPAQFVPKTAGFEYEKRDVMIAMRDGVKLHTIIIVPTGARRAPILLTRTPYKAKDLTSRSESSHLGPILQGYDNAVETIVEGGYIRVVQDIRGKYGSEGDYVMNRPLSGPRNPTPVDHATDTYDTIEWLVHNIPETNGNVGILGISYDGFLPLMALFNPHPALKVSVPMNPMVDGWRGDDWFHNGAFRQQNISYIYEQQASRSNDFKWWTSHFDDYDMYMQAVSAGEIGRRRGMEQIGFWNKLVEHPAYDAWWQDQAMDRLLAAAPLKVPVMLVHSLWDQEDIYGAPAVYKAIEPKDVGNDKVFLVMGPWHHGQEIGDGSHLGEINFDSDTGLYFRRRILLPFLDHFLKDGAPALTTAPVTAFETGSNEWRRLDAWPPKSVISKPLYLHAGLKVSFDPPKAGTAAWEEYVADPMKPVTYPARPNHAMQDSAGSWSRWLVDDQRDVASRPDVVSFVSDVLAAPLQISGEPIVNLVASTSGTDSDWVVKLIDVYPDEVASQPSLGGFQLMISADIFRGRYRESFETARAIEPNKPLPYKFVLPNANHVFLPGHRIMVQIQSSWFPLYDRNPQTFGANIFWAKPEDYRKATQRIYHSPEKATFISLPVVSAN